MKGVLDMKIVEGLYYTKNHEWIEAHGMTGAIGITDYAQHALGDIVFVELPEEGDAFEKDEAFGAIESVKTASDVYMPVSGTVSEVNIDLEEEPELLNENCYKNWMIKIEIADLSELDGLMSPEEYEVHISEEE